MEAFTDTWPWDDATSGQAVKEVKQMSYQDAAKMLDAMVGFLDKNALTAYLAMMAVRLVELRRMLKPTGRLYLHRDPTAGYYGNRLRRLFFREIQLRFAPTRLGKLITRWIEENVCLQTGVE